MSRIDIREVRTIQRDGVLILAVAGGGEDGRDAQVVLSIDEWSGDQDRRLGLDGLHLEWNGQAGGGYGVVESIGWIGVDLEIATTAAAQGEGTPERIALSGLSDHLDAEGRRMVDRLLAQV